MLGAIGDPEDPDDMFDVRDVSEFSNTILENASTEENYLRPRMEILVDLGLIKRKVVSGSRRADFMWEVTDVTERLAAEWIKLAVGQNAIPRYLDEEFFASMSRSLQISGRRSRSPKERMLWFTRAFQRTGREFGFTPGRTCALLGCLLAYESGVLIEIKEMFDTILEAGKSEWAQYFHFSGGSRFDREFLVRIDQEALNALE
jgi:hypothetical protein